MNAYPTLSSGLWVAFRLVGNSATFFSATAGVEVLVLECWGAHQASL